MTTLRLTLAALLAVALPGCGGDEAPTPSPEPPPGAPLLTYVRSGGIAGSLESLAVTRTGNARYETAFGRSRDARSFALSARELTELERVLSEHPISSFPEPDPDAQCADCYQYDLTYGGQSFTASDVTLPDDAGPVLGAVRALIEAHVPDAPPGAG